MDHRPLAPNDDLPPGPFATRSLRLAVCSLDPTEISNGWEQRNFKLDSVLKDF
jgi:hypothetical protein